MVWILDFSIDTLKRSFVGSLSDLMAIPPLFSIIVLVSAFCDAVNFDWDALDRLTQADLRPREH